MVEPVDHFNDDENNVITVNAEINTEHVTTLNDLKKRRELLLQQRNLIILQHQKRSQSNPTSSSYSLNSERNIQNNTKLSDNVLDVTSSTRYLAECETTTFYISNLADTCDGEKDCMLPLGSPENLPETVSTEIIGCDINNIDLDISLNDSVVSFVPLSDITNVEPIVTASTEGNNDTFPEVELEPECARESRKRKLKADQMACKRTRNKKCRMLGQEYVGFKKNSDEKYSQDSIKPARKLGDSCRSVKCVKSKVINCKKFSDSERRIIFNKFWQMTWEEKRMFVCSMIDIKSTNRKTTGRSDSRRGRTKVYYLKLEEQKERVCLKTFLGTLGIKEWTMRYWLGERPNVTKTLNTNQEQPIRLPTLKNSIQHFLRALPKLPSHYCRQNSTKLYLEPLIPSKRELFRIYVADAKRKLQRVASRKLFEDNLREENIAIFKPKKDDCDLCCSYKVGNVSVEVYQRHTSLKELARKEKNKDKEAAKKGLVHVITADLQAVKLCPFLNASALYFKTKLMVHNFTIYNLGDSNVVCYWFDETTADLKATTYASFCVDYLTKILMENPKDVIIFTDGCTSQNRNTVVSNALLQLAMQKNITITQKFLEKGHTQMEVDSVHSLIERKLRNREIFLPSQYASITREIRLNPSPYKVIMPDYTFFKDYSIKTSLIYDSIRPGRGLGAKCVVDLRVLKYNPNGTIEYKLDYNDNFQMLPKRPKKVGVFSPPQLFFGPLPISKSKYDHLQQLKEVIPKDCHEFYDKLQFKD